MKPIPKSLLALTHADHRTKGPKMTETDQPFTRQAIEAKNRSGKLTVSGKLKTAIDLMLYGNGSPDGPTCRTGR
jgi:hypothetical protein